MATKSKTTGRPQFKATVVRKEAVAILRRCKFTDDKIASFLECSESTLRSRFRKELAEGPDQIDARIAIAAFKAAERGNARAIALWTEQFTGQPLNPHARKRPVGKRRIAEVESETASDDTSWEALLPH
jgi:AraC-like DNA-binding protein